MPELAPPSIETDDLSPQALAHAAQRAGELMELIWRQRDAGADLWVFGYASLIWHPEVHHTERRTGRVYGFHRSFRMRSRVNRGTPQRPGLVFALRPGGSCAGVALRVPRERARAELERLWQREMPLPTYEPRWLSCHTPRGVVQALAFILPRSSPSYTGTLNDEAMLAVLRHARGRYGTTLEYLLRTEASLRELGIRDEEVHRLVNLARHHGLTG
jgi:cation transport protein ChaC